MMKKNRDTAASQEAFNQSQDEKIKHSFWQIQPSLTALPLCLDKPVI